MTDNTPSGEGPTELQRLSPAPSALLPPRLCGTLAAAIGSEQDFLP
jgi:hypothetical protein